MTGMILDALLMLLLVAAIGYGVRLERKLVLLRYGQAAFGRAVAELNGAVGRAEYALSSLKDAGEEADLLHDRILKARALRDELEGLERRASRPVPVPVPVAVAVAPAPPAEPASHAPKAGVAALVRPITPERARTEGRARIDALFAQARGRLDARTPPDASPEGLFAAPVSALASAPVSASASAPVHHADKPALNRRPRTIDDELFAA